MLAFSLLKTSVKSWYSSGMLDRSTEFLEVVELSDLEGLEIKILKLTAPGNLLACMKAAALIIEM